MAKRRQPKTRARSQYSWQIRGYEGAREIYREDLSAGQFTDNTVKACLQALCARALTPSETIGALTRRKTKRANPLLDVRFDASSRMYLCGTGVHYLAVRVAKNITSRGRILSGGRGKVTANKSLGSKGDG
jgi:hypothetical protein